MSDPARPAGFTGLVEFRPGFVPRPDIRHVLFDFDGTLSLIREGWPQVMVPMFAEALPPRPGETAADRERLAHEDIMRLTGKQTIYQMIQLAERIRERGGMPREPLEYKHEYLRRLDRRIAGRIADLRAGRRAPEDFLLHGSRRLLAALAARGLTLHLASGTDETYVREEAVLLDVAKHFGPRIHGARDDYRSFSKKLVIGRILAEHGISGEHLLAIGDGYVEIENTKQAGGLAIAVASDEAANGAGRFDPWKHRRLLEVGADVVVPDYRDAEALVAAVMG
jgi:phosphoglycolate phosphatase-like HAD superfamily hydrolase